MRAEFNIQPEAFAFGAEPGEFIARQAEVPGPWQQEENRDSAGYIRWLQAALNQVLGLNLVVDGSMGARSAIRTFQQRQGLTADGIVGPRTEAELIAAGASRSPGAAAGTPALCSPQSQFVDCPRPDLRPTEVLDRFDFDKCDLTPHHTPTLIKVARQIIASRRTRQPISSVTLAGHTDTAGGDDYNFALARRRASVVMELLCNTLERMLPGGTRGIRFQLTSCGERQPESTLERSRRVAVYLPTKAPPPPISPVPVPPTPPVTIGARQQVDRRIDRQSSGPRPLHDAPLSDPGGPPHL